MAERSRKMFQFFASIIIHAQMMIPCKHNVVLLLLPGEVVPLDAVDAPSPV